MPPPERQNHFHFSTISSKLNILIRGHASIMSGKCLHWLMGGGVGSGKILHAYLGGGEKQMLTSLPSHTYIFAIEIMAC